MVSSLTRSYNLMRSNNLRNKRMHIRKLHSRAMAVLLCAGFAAANNAAAADARPLDGDYVIHDFQFASGETLPELRIHYTFFGKPKKDAQGRISNAVLIMHGTGGSGPTLIHQRLSGGLC